MSTHVYTLLADVRGGERHWSVIVEIDGGVQPMDWIPGEETAHATRWILTVDVPAHHRTH